MGCNYDESLYKEYDRIAEKYERIKKELDVLKYKYRLQEQLIARLRAKEAAQASKEKDWATQKGKWLGLLPLVKLIALTAVCLPPRPAP